MTADEFRALALSFPEAVESSHMNHPDFRVRGKIFATLGYPGRGWGCLNLPPMEQNRLLRMEPDVYFPAKGAWGRAGATQVHLRLARKGSVRAALRAAWENQVPEEPLASGKARKVPPVRRTSSRTVRRTSKRN